MSNEPKKGTNEPPVEYACPQCKVNFRIDLLGEPKRCPKCDIPLGPQTTNEPPVDT